MTPNYIDFAYFCLFIFSLAHLLRSFYKTDSLSKKGVEEFYKNLSTINQYFFQLLTIGWLMRLLTGFYYGFFLWLTHESFFKIISFFASQITLIN